MRVSIICVGLLAYSTLAGAAEKSSSVEGATEKNSKHVVGASSGTADVLVPSRHTPPPPIELGLVGKLDWHEDSDKLIVTTPKGYKYTVGIPKDDSALLEKLQNLAGKQVEIKGTLHREKGTNLLVASEVAFDSSTKAGEYWLSMKDSERAKFEQLVVQLRAEFPRAAIDIEKQTYAGFSIKSDLNRSFLQSVLAEKAPYAKLN